MFMVSVLQVAQQLDNTWDWTVSVLASFPGPTHPPTQVIVVCGESLGMRLDACSE